jgi:SAM-dependent methyltransferase
MSFTELESVLNRTVSPRDRLYPVYEAQYGAEEYFRSALRQLDVFDALLAKHAGKHLRECARVADFGCHYGRLLRCLRAALPEATLYACDVDEGAVAFCEREFGCIPFVTGWAPERAAADMHNDLVISISLVTHTDRSFFARVLGLWEQMLAPGGLLLFTYLGEDFIARWLAGEMEHYGPVDEAAKAERAARFREQGHTFYGYPSEYSDAEEYGVGFLRRDIVEAEIAEHPSLKLVEVVPGIGSAFGQDLAVVRKTAA